MFGDYKAVGRFAMILGEHMEYVGRDIEDGKVVDVWARPVGIINGDQPMEIVDVTYVTDAVLPTTDARVADRASGTP